MSQADASEHHEQHDHPVIATPPEEPKSGGGGWVSPAFIALMSLSVLFWYLLKGQEMVVDGAAKPAAHAEAAKPTPWSALGEFSKRSLPDGTELSIPQRGVENQLIDSLEPSKPLDKETWFDFDRLLFDTGKATLQPESQAQLKDVAAILKAFPKVHAQLGGYTDNAGDKAANTQLSQDRATNVERELVGYGVDAKRLEAKGYGEDHPIGSNDSEEGRAKNRRISLRITEK